MEKEVCWNITARCNQNCKYCHRFQNPKDLSFEDNNRILDNLIASGVKNITWTGGEALLVNGLDELLERAHKYKIRNKLITNGKLLTHTMIDKIYKYLDNLTLSIDSINNETNKNLGRGEFHYTEVKDILDYIKKKKYNLKVCINIVVCKLNLNDIKDLIDFLNNYDIYSIRAFKFMPLRERAIDNKDMFDITDSEYESVVKYIINNSVSEKLDTRVTSDMQNKYILILANGDIVVTKKEGDVVIGNALVNSLSRYL